MPGATIGALLSVMADERMFAGVLVKVTLREETRRFDLGESVSFDRLKDLIAERFSVPVEAILLHYKDEEDDLVVVSSDVELKEAVSSMSCKGFRFFASLISQGNVGDFIEVEHSEAALPQKEDPSKSDGEEGKRARKVAKKHTKKVDKQEQKRELLKRDLLDELRKEMQDLRDEMKMKGTSSSASFSSHVAFDSPCGPQGAVPSGEKLQTLLQAFVKAVGAPEDEVYQTLNTLTPEKIREALSFSPFSGSDFMRFVSSFCLRSQQPQYNPSPPFVVPSVFDPRQFGPHPTFGLPPHAYGPHYGMPPPHHGMPSPSFHEPPPPPFHGMPPPPPPPPFVDRGWGGHQFKHPARCFDWDRLNPQPISAENIPTPPLAPIVFSACGDNVSALNSCLSAVGYSHPHGHCHRNRFGRKTYYELCRLQADNQLPTTGLYDEATRLVLVNKLQTLKDSLSMQTPVPAQVINSVTICDTDGDVMVFSLKDESRVEETVNGQLELESVTLLEIDDSTGIVRDVKGVFKIKEEERVEKIAALRNLLSRVGGSVTTPTTPQPPSLTLEIDIDLNADGDKMKEQQRVAGEAIQQACVSLGSSAETAQNIFSQLFKAINSGTPPAAEGCAHFADKSSVETQCESKMETDGACMETGTHFRDELLMVLDMGFDDIDLITSLLERYKGDVSRVVGDLAQSAV